MKKQADTLKNQTLFQAGTSEWWSTTNGIPVAITNVMVGSLGDYQATNNVDDIGPVIPSNCPGANLGDMGTYQVDITNVFYELVIPDIWITPRDAVACVDGSNVEFTVTGTNIPLGVTWTIYPTNFTGHAGFQSATNYYAEVIPGSVATNYKVRATAKNNTNFWDEVTLEVVKVDIVESNVYVGVSNTVSLHLTPDSSTNVQWEISPTAQNGASIEGSSAGTSVVINAGSIPTNYTVRAYIANFTNCYDTCMITVLKMGLLQAGFDCTDSSKVINLKKTESDTYTNDTYISDGNTAITNPVWQDLNLDDVPDVTPSDPVCFITNAVPKIVQGKLDIKPDIATQTIDAKLKVEATPVGAAGTLDNLTFGPENITLTSSNVTFPAISEAEGKTVGSVVNNFKYVMVWSISLDNGDTWNTFQKMTQVVFVVYSTPKTNYFDINYINYPSVSMSCTAKRFSQVTEWAKGESVINSIATKCNDATTFTTDNYTNNPFSAMDNLSVGWDCISCANISATACRLLGLDAHPYRAYCTPTIATNDSSTLGWSEVYHLYHKPNSGEDIWYHAWEYNNFEGFFYFGTLDISSSVFPGTAWFRSPSPISVTTEPGKEKYLPVSILSNCGVGLLEFRIPPDGVGWITEWKPGNTVAGVSMQQYPYSWMDAPSYDGTYDVQWDAANRTLKLHDGTTVAIATNGEYVLPCSIGDLKVDVTTNNLPTINATGQARVVKPHNLASVP